MFLEETENGYFVFLEMNQYAYHELSPSQRAQFDNNPKMLVKEEETGDTVRFRIVQYMENKFAEVLSGMKIPFHLEYAFNTKKARLTKKFISQLHVNIQGGNYPLKDLKI
jgi:hypothetical protein